MDITITIPANKLSRVKAAYASKLDIEIPDLTVADFEQHIKREIRRVVEKHERKQHAFDDIF